MQRRERFIYFLYILKVYTKMRDVYENTILCSECNRKTEKGYIIKDGFRLRFWKCNNCNKIWYHPADTQEYDEFNRLKQKQFTVKLRMVGNSYTISIPKEIIDFEEEFYKEVNKIVSLCLEEPSKLTLFFNKRIRKVY